MKQIKVKIPGHELFDDLDFLVKESWPELNPNEFLKCCNLMFATLDDQHLAMGLAFTELVQLPKDHLKKLGELLMSDDDGTEGMLHLFSCLDFVMKERPVFGKSLMPHYRNFQGPADDLSNVIWYQFGNAELYFHLFLQENELNDLENCLSYLYSKGTFDRLQVKAMKAEIVKWPLETKQAAFINYMGLRNEALGVEPVSEQKEETKEMSPIEALASDFEDNNPAEDALKLPYRWASDKLGTVTDIQNMLVPDVLQLVEQMRDEIPSKQDVHD